MNLPDKIEYIELKSIVVNDKTVQLMTNDSALTIMGTINQLIDYLKEKEESQTSSNEIDYKHFAKVLPIQLKDGLFYEAQIIVPGKYRWFGEIKKRQSSSVNELNKKLSELTKGEQK